MATPTINDAWNYYQNSYGGNLPEETFMQLANSVQMRLDELIYSREVPENMEQRYKQTFSELIDFRNQTKSAALQGGIVETETIDGYTVKYRSNSYKTQLHDEFRIAEKYLTYPKDLMYCGTERKCNYQEFFNVWWY